MFRKLYANYTQLRDQYPRQFWLMFWGLLLSTIGSSMIWPFLLIYASKKLDLPLTTVATLITINATTAVIMSFIAGPIADRIGRKRIMVISLFSEAITFLLMTQAATYPAFAVLMFLRGLSNPLYRVGADAMLADLIPSEQRTEAYSLIRMINNAGIAIGPALGGSLAAISYNYSFIGAAIGIGAYGILLAILARETLPVVSADQRSQTGQRFGGYDRVLADKRFIAPIGAMTFGWVAASLMWVILPVHANKNFSIPENIYAWIPTTNAAMIVLLQFAITRITRRYPILWMMALGMFFYALSNLGVAFSGGFFGFWICMVIMTLGELTIVPTSSAYVADIAPADMRGRYMSVYGLTWAYGSSVGPILGGLLNDNFGPIAIWYGGFTIGLIATLALILIGFWLRPAKQQ